MNMHERMMSGKLFTDMCEGLPQERGEGKRRMIAFNRTTPDQIEEHSGRLHCRRQSLPHPA